MENKIQKMKNKMKNKMKQMSKNSHFESDIIKNSHFSKSFLKQPFFKVTAISTKTCDKDVIKDVMEM